MKEVEKTVTVVSEEKALNVTKKGKLFVGARGGIYREDKNGVPTDVPPAKEPKIEDISYLLITEQLDSQRRVQNLLILRQKLEHEHDHLTKEQAIKTGTDMIEYGLSVCSTERLASLWSLKSQMEEFGKAMKDHPFTKIEIPMANAMRTLQEIKEGIGKDRDANCGFEAAMKDIRYLVAAAIALKLCPERKVCGAQHNAIERSVIQYLEYAFFRYTPQQELPSCPFGKQILS